MDLSAISVLMLDVDGVLTDGRVTLSEDGETASTFDVHDGCMIKLWQRAGGRVAILSGRSSPAVRRRAEELHIAVVRQGAADKSAAFEELLAELAVESSVVCYVGDDLPDLGPLGRCGFPVAVANGVGEVKRAARYVTARCGGHGAVAEVVELILRKQRRWSRSLLSEV